MIYFNYLLNKTNRIFQPAGKEAFGDKSRKTANTLCASLKPTEKWFNKLINSSMTISWVLQAIHTTPLHISLIHGNKQDILGSVHHTHCTTLHFFQHHVQSSRLLFTLMRQKKKKKKKIRDKHPGAEPLAACYTNIQTLLFHYQLMCPRQSCISSWWMLRFFRE